jgi:hypothetical protein
MIKSRRTDEQGTQQAWGEIRNTYKILVGKPEIRDHLEDLGADCTIILNGS